MPREERKKPKGNDPKMDWEAWANPLIVAEPGWREENAETWNCTMCKKYVKMYHIMKLWPLEVAQKYGRRREGPVSSCLSQHFPYRYHEITIAVGIKNTRPEIMLYSNMAMVWAEIVLHKNIDWSTVMGLNVDRLDRTRDFIPTNWIGPSDCHTRYSERTVDMDAQLQHDATPTGYGGITQDTHTDNESAPLSFGIGSEGYYQGQGQYGGGGYSSNYPTPMYTGGAYESGSQHNSGSNVQGYSSSTYPTNTYDRENQYGRAIGTPEYRTASHPKDTYEYGGQYDRRSDILGYTNYGYGEHASGSNDIPSAPFLSREEEDAQFERDMQEARMQSQQEYIQRLEGEKNFMTRCLFGESSGGPYTSGAGPSRRHNDTDSDEE